MRATVPSGQERTREGRGARACRTDRHSRRRRRSAAFARHPATVAIVGARHHADHRLGHHALRAGRAGQADRRRHRLEPEPRVRRPHRRPAGLERHLARSSAASSTAAAASSRMSIGSVLVAVGLVLLALVHDPYDLSRGLGLPRPRHAHDALRRRVRRPGAGDAVARPARHLLPHAVRRLRLQRVLAHRPCPQRRLRLAHDAAHFRRHQSRSSACRCTGSGWRGARPPSRPSTRGPTDAAAAPAAPPLEGAARTIAMVLFSVIVAAQRRRVRRAGGASGADPGGRACRPRRPCSSPRSRAWRRSWAASGT